MKTKEQKRREAAERREFYTKLSVKQKLAMLSERPGNCARQIAKLLSVKEK